MVGLPTKDGLGGQGGEKHKVDMVELVDEVDKVDNLDIDNVDKDMVDNVFFRQFAGTPPAVSRSFPTHPNNRI